MKPKLLVNLVVLCVIAALLALAPVTTPVVAQSSALQLAAAGTTIPYSGQLSDDAGQPAADGLYAFSFALYDAAQGGGALWAEIQSGVALQDGAFSVQLGSLTPLPSAARLKSAWLAVGVRGPDEADFTALEPRQQIDTTAPAAPSSPEAGAACAHNHLGEYWQGDTGDPPPGSPVIPGLYVYLTNDNAAPAIRGESDEGSGVWGISDTYYGVMGWSEHGTGVSAGSVTGPGMETMAYSSEYPAIYAWHDDPTAPAIKILGSIQVENAGIDSDTPVFIHKVNTASGGNICAIQNYSTVIDNPITNNRSNAILVVTPNYGANNTGVAPAVGIPAVYYDATNACGKGAGKWVIYNLNSVAQNNNSMFNVMVVIP